MGHETPVIKFLRKLLNPGDIFIDVGAFIGFYTIYAAKLGAKVVAFEPHPSSFEILLYNITLNNLADRITAINKAVGSYKGTLKFKLAFIPSRSSGTDFLNNDKVVKDIEVPMIDLDSFFEWSTPQQKLNRVPGILYLDTCHT